MKRLIAVPVLAAAATLTIAGCSSSKPTIEHGTEHISLSSHSSANDALLQGTANGPVFSGPGTVRAESNKNNAPLHAFFPGGSFIVYPYGKGGPSSAKTNSKTCAVKQVGKNQKFTVSSGTGNLQHISGKGTATITFTAVMPRLSNGKCNFSDSAKPMAGTAFQTVDATIYVRVPR